MGFSFGFTEDIEDKGEGGFNIEQKNDFVNPIDNVKDNGHCAKSHTMEELLKSSCLDTRFTFEPVEAASGVVLLRRVLYDVRHQLMMEDRNVNKALDSEEFNILIGETGEDLKNGVYEGGLKSWECSFDIIKTLHGSGEFGRILEEGKENVNVIELGCGTSLPTLYLLHTVYKHRTKKKLGRSSKPVKILLSDYNFDVLRLVTLPNILINWAFGILSNEELYQLQSRNGLEGNIREGELDVTLPMIVRFQEWLMEENIEISFISGSWSRQFMDLAVDLLPHIDIDYNVVLTSETIYSPHILPVISEMMVELTRSKGISLLAAKDIYFGVGGSVVECVRYLEQRDVSVTTIPAGGSLQRSVLSLRPASL